MTLGRIEQREVVEPGAYLRMVGSKATFGGRQHALGHWRRCCLLRGPVQLDDLPIEALQIVGAGPRPAPAVIAKTRASESSCRKDV